MEVTGRHNFIRTRASDLVSRNLRVTRMLSLNKKIISLSGRKHRFLRKSTLYINGFCNSEQFDSICLDYVHQLVESVVAHGKYEDNM